MIRRLLSASLLALSAAACSISAAPNASSGMAIGKGTRAGTSGGISFSGQGFLPSSDIEGARRRCCRPDRFKARFVPSRSIRAASVL